MDAGAVTSKPLEVLLVEDNDTHAHLIRRRLGKTAGDSVVLHHLERLSEALERLDRGGIDAVLLDLKLPDSQIDETLPRLFGAHNEIPIVVLTSLDDLEFGTQAVGQGAQDFLVKTDLSGELLLRSIRHAIERKRVQDRLESYAAELEGSNEQLKGFAHTVAHEVKSPLTVVAICLQMLSENFQGKIDDEVWEHVQAANSALHGLTNMVNDLLEFARVGAGRGELKEVNLEAVFYQAYVALRPVIKDQDVVVTHDPLPTIRGNESQLRQLLVNLIGNSVKYRGQQPPEIHVSAAADDRNWIVSVRDNGLGIAPENHARIFEAFVRLHDQDTIAGSGIGLAFCARIVENHGGRIWVESSLGDGSEFKFTLPKFVATLD